MVVHFEGLKGGFLSSVYKRHHLLWPYLLRRKIELIAATASLAAQPYVVKAIFEESWSHCCKPIEFSQTAQYKYRRVICMGQLDAKTEAEKEK